MDKKMDSQTDEQVDKKKDILTDKNRQFLSLLGL